MVIFKTHLKAFHGIVLLYEYYDLSGVLGLSMKELSLRDKVIEIPTNKIPNSLFS
jgi:hypothetical protein